MPEVILNLWYVMDQSGLIFSLKAKPYVAIGEDVDKTKFLQSRASLDYMIAKDFKIPENFTSHLSGHTFKGIMYHSLTSLTSELMLFENCFKDLEMEFSPMGGLKIPKEPLVCITPLHLTDDLKLKLFDKNNKF